MPFLVPLASDLPFFDIRLTVENAEYRMAFRYNQRIDRWYFDLFDAEENPLTYGRKIVTGVPLLRSIEYKQVPPGQLIALSETPDKSAAKRFDLGDRVQVYYFTESEVAAL